MEARQLIVFAIDSDEYGIDISQISSIEKLPEIFKVPEAADYVEGLINLRGKVHTAINIRKRLKKPVREFDEETKVIMVYSGDSIVGIIIDNVNQMIKLEEGNYELIPNKKSGSDKEFVDYIAVSGEKKVKILNLEKLIAL